MNWPDRNAFWQLMSQKLKDRKYRWKIWEDATIANCDSSKQSTERSDHQLCSNRKKKLIQTHIFHMWPVQKRSTERTGREFYLNRGKNWFFFVYTYFFKDMYGLGEINILYSLCFNWWNTWLFEKKIPSKRDIHKSCKRVCLTIICL